MVAGGDDDVHREDGIGDGQRRGPSAAHSWVQGAGAPEGPRAVQARHRRERVRDRPHRLGVERPERRVLDERVDEAERLPVAEHVEQPRRHQGEEGEPDEPERGHDRQRVAPQRVGVRALAVHPDDDPERGDAGTRTRRSSCWRRSPAATRSDHSWMASSWLMPRACCQSMISRAFSKAISGAGDGPAADQLVEAVHDEHGDDLLPPVQDRPVAQRPTPPPPGPGSRREGCRPGHRFDLRLAHQAVPQQSIAPFYGRHARWNVTNGVRHTVIAQLRPTACRCRRRTARRPGSGRRCAATPRRVIRRRHTPPAGPARWEWRRRGRRRRDRRTAAPGGVR